jgi:hypothetical protein
MISVTYNGTFGNNLWQYAVGRLYAEKHGHRLYCPPIVGLPKTEESIDGLGVVGNFTEVGGHVFDFNTCRGDVHLNGSFQRYEYLRGNREKLREWFELKIDANADIGDDDLVLSIRRGWNGYPTHLCPPASFYSALLKSLNPRRIYLCTDSFDDGYFAFLRDFPNVVYYRENYLKQFDLIRRAKTVILSPSTFCWWAAYLGDADRILYPWYSDMIPTETGVNWWVDDDSRYVKVGI